jgi:hypothetical protein
MVINMKFQLITYLALQLYKDTIGASMNKILVTKARDARKADGSVLEYGLDWQLERFVGAVCNI